MCKDIIKKIYDISKEYDVKEITLITNHLKCYGTLCECKNEKDDYILTLTNAKILRLEDACKCGMQDCKCDEESFYSTEWLHVNLDKIVAFSITKE